MNHYGYQTYGSGASPSQNQNWQQSPPPNQYQNWQQNQSAQWGHAPQQQPPQQAPQPGYHPGTYGVMPGAQQSATAPPIPHRDSTSMPGQQQYSQYSQPTPPPPPPKPAGMYQSTPQQHTYTVPQQQNSYTQNNAPNQTSQLPQTYYPPPSSAGTSAQYGSSQVGMSSTPAPAPAPVPSSTMPGVSESQPAYIAPSLSGQGVAAYMPSNTNPLPGVYVPPPPDVPAWTHASQLPSKNKFKYTPPVVHPSYQSNIPHYGAQSVGAQSYQQPGMASSGQNVMPQSQQQQWGSNSQPPQYEHGTQIQTQQYAQGAQSQPQQYGQAGQGQYAYTNSQGPQPPPNQYQQPQSSQTQSWNASQEQIPQQLYGTPVPPQPQTGWQRQRMSQDGNNNQTYQEPQNQPVHRPSVPLSQDSYSSISSPNNDPISPLSHRQSMDFGGISPSTRKDSVGLGRKPVGSSASSIKEEPAPQPSQLAQPAQHTQTNQTVSPMGTAATGASALGFGGPSDWEHFGGGVEEIDDTAHFGAKSTQQPPLPIPQPDISELPSGPSPPPQPVPQEGYHRPGPATEGWPTPPAPAPATLNKPLSRPSSGFHPTPTPPPGARHSSNASVVSVEQGRTGTPVQQQWGRQSAPSSRPSSIASLRQPWQKPTAPPSTISENTSFTMDDGGFMSPDGSSSQQYQPLGPSLTERKETPSGVLRQQTPQTGSVLDAGHVSTVEQSKKNLVVDGKPEEAPSSFAIDDGSWPAKAEQLPADRREIPKPSAPSKPADLIPELDPWYIGSLERYIEMLRQEAAAPAVEDKINIFRGFLAAESQARMIPYYYDMPVAQLIAAISDSADAQLKTDKEDAPLESHRSTETIRPKVSTTTDDFVMVSSDERYSPGGRPVMIGRSQSKGTITPDVTEGEISRPPTRDSLDDKAVPSAPSPLSGETGSDRKNTPSSAYRPYRHSVSASDSTQSAILTPTSSVPDEPIKPAAQPTQDMPPPNLPGFRPYVPSETVTSPSVVSSPPLSSVPLDGHRRTGSTPRQEHDLFFNEPPKVETKPIPFTSITPATPVERKAPSPPVDSRTESLPQSLPTNAEPTQPPEHTSTKQNDDLSSKLPLQLPSVEPSHPRLAMIIQDLPKRFPSDFAFITDLTKTFEATAATLRRDNERARTQRQEAEETRTNNLFDNNEISYADIGPLEDKFKAEEVQLKAQEDQAEYNKYSEVVFNEVYLRLQKEIGELMDFRQETMSHLEHSLAGKAVLEGGSDEAEPGTTLQAVQALRALHNSLEERHDRVAGAVSERDKRYKKTQVQPLYAAGNIKKLKEMERHFDAAEKNASLQHREQRATRRKELFDIVESNVRRAVEQNVAYEKEVLDVLPTERDAGIRAKAKETLRLLSDTSMALMQALGEIERELCGAEFDVEVGRARARPEAVDDAVIKKVEEQGAKEVERVEQSVRDHLAVLEDAWKEVEKAFEQQAPPPATDELDDRARAQKRALEEAKRRNGDFA